MKSVWRHPGKLTCLIFFACLSIACGGTDNALSEAQLAEEQESRLRGWESHFEEMSQALSLDEAERASLTGAFLERDDVLREWLEGPEGRRLIELEAQLADAAGSRDLSGVRAITSEASPLRRKFERLVADSEATLLSTLTPEQQRDWDTWRLSKKLLDLMEGIGLSEEQKLQIRERAFDFLAQAHGAGEPNPEAAAFLEFERWAQRSVLDSTQSGMYEEIKRENPLRSLR